MHLTVIAKQPRPGLVKTRLCPPCTPDEAAALAAAALSDTLDEIDRLVARTAAPVQRVLLFDGVADEWLRPGWHVLAQRGDGLDERLSNGFDDLGRGVIVGMETPQAIDSVAHALRAVADGRDAIGLAVDGGYWAIALGNVDRRAIEAVPMSTSYTGLAQLRRLHGLGRNVALLGCARDLDAFDDVVDAAHRADGTPLLRTTAIEVIANVAVRAQGAG